MMMEMSELYSNLDTTSSSLPLLVFRQFVKDGLYFHFMNQKILLIKKSKLIKQ